jgi:probable rRNA maturation factor
MTIEVDVQVATEFEPIPQEEQLRDWAKAALRDRNEGELTLRLVDRAESKALNSRYRKKDVPTNVLSFPAELPAGIDIPLMGDIVICAPLVFDQAEELGKPLLHIWAHLVIHGVLHLLGHDHVDESDAEEMEALEIGLLSALGIANPYD